MSYIREIQAGKKVTVNVSKAGYAPNSIVINPMPAEDITRQILLTRNAVTIKVIYGPNTENPGEEVLIYDGIISPNGNNAQLLLNGNSVEQILVSNDKFPPFNTQGNPFFILIGTKNYARLYPSNASGGVVQYSNIMPIDIGQNIINNSELEIVLYKVIVGRMVFMLNGNQVNLGDVGYKLKDFYCSEIGDYIGEYAKLMGLVNGSIVANRYSYMIGYTYTFILEDPQGNTITRNIQINPSQQQIQQEDLFDIIINLND